MIKRKFLPIFLLGFIAACTETKKETHINPAEVISAPTNRVVVSAEIKWEPLNPARGDKSPKAGTIWGDRNGQEATGFLAKFVDGFSSPPHIHNVTYRAMVIKGLIHNDDPSATKMWMPTGSFWTQPAGEPHITAAKGEENIVYVEIDHGPYLVKPVSEAFDNGERPINIDKNNLIWLDASETLFIDANHSALSPEVAFLWENEGTKGNLIKLPPGFEGRIMSEGDSFHAIVILGTLEYILPQTQEVKGLDPGSYFTSTGKSQHNIQANKGVETILYIRTDGKIHIQ